MQTRALRWPAQTGSPARVSGSADPKAGASHRSREGTQLRLTDGRGPRRAVTPWLLGKPFAYSLADVSCFKSRLPAQKGPGEQETEAPGGAGCPRPQGSQPGREGAGQTPSLQHGGPWHSVTTLDGAETTAGVSPPVPEPEGRACPGHWHPAKPAACIPAAPCSQRANRPREANSFIRSHTA